MPTEPIIFYCKTTCSWCNAVHDLLNTHGLAYDERDAERHPELLGELRRATGQEEIPTLKIGNDWLLDTDAGDVADRLGLLRPAQVKAAQRQVPRPPSPGQG